LSSLFIGCERDKYCTIGILSMREGRWRGMGVVEVGRYGD
jgi:hypothetical protein